MPVHYPEYAGKPYRPSNGEEGRSFMQRFCNHCAEDQTVCEILTTAILFDIDQKDYPKEWKYDGDGRPTCTAFCARRTATEEEPDQERCKHTLDLFEE